MPVKAFAVPKYAQIVTTLRERITSGDYAMGQMIPSESQLIAEFGASRPIVVRALGILEQDGWIVAEHGRGRFVRRTHDRAAHAGAGRGLLASEQGTRCRLVSVGVVDAPPRIAAALGVVEGASVWARCRLVASPIGPVQLATVYTRLELAAGTDLAEERPMRGVVTEHLSAVKGIGFDTATDRLGARLPTAHEARLLEVTRREPLLSVLVTCFDTTTTPQVVVDALVVASRLELEDSFPLA